MNERHLEFPELSVLRQSQWSEEDFSLYHAIVEDLLKNNVALQDLTNLSKYHPEMRDFGHLM